MKEEYRIVVTNHNDKQFVRKYWTETQDQAAGIALSEAYPFGIKNVEYRVRWTAIDDSCEAYIDIIEVFGTAISKEWEEQILKSLTPVLPGNKMKHAKLKHKSKPIW